MKVRSNPAHSPSAIQHPFIAGAYVGATVDADKTLELGALTFKFDDAPVDLLAAGETLHAYMCKRQQEYAYFVKKCQTGELLPADEEMAKAAGLELPKSAKPVLATK